MGRLRDADPYFYTFKRTEIGQIFWKDIIHGSMRGILLRNGGVSFAEIGGGNVFFTQ